MCTAQSMKVLRKLHVNVKYNSHGGIHKLFVVDGIRPNFMGRNWLYYLQLDWLSLGVAPVTKTSKVLFEMLTT